LSLLGRDEKTSSAAISTKALLRAVLRSMRVENSRYRDAILHRGLDVGIQKQLLEESPLFDKEWYHSNYGDIAAVGVDPVDHYLSSGWIERRNPSAFFDTDFYLRKHPDVLNSEMNPLVHFLCFGMFEGRVIRSLTGDEIAMDR
jgi:hypothetical protein